MDFKVNNWHSGDSRIEEELLEGHSCGKKNTFLDGLVSSIEEQFVIWINNSSYFYGQFNYLQLVLRELFAVSKTTRPEENPGNASLLLRTFFCATWNILRW